MKNIELKGVTQNNLKNVDIELPLGSFIVICGPSGSGKSSLAFQTLYAEGQRRYLESLSNYAKQFVGRAPKPALESAINIPPTIALEQKNSIKSSRSTVGTHSDLYDYVRSLFAKVGKPLCPDHNIELIKYDPSSATQGTLADLNGKRAYMLSPLNWSGKKAAQTLRSKILEMGYLKVAFLDENKISDLIDIEYEEMPEESEDAYLVVDRVEINEESEIRIFDGFSQCYEVSKTFNGQPEAVILTTTGDFLRFRDVLSCKHCDYSFAEISPELFSFNNSLGACPQCKGFGNHLEIDIKKIIPNPSLSIKGGALVPFEMPSAKQDKRALVKACGEHNIDVDKAWNKLPKSHQRFVWEGSGKWFGVKGLFEYLETKKYKMHVRVFLSRFKSASPCTMCEGARVNPKVKQVKIDNKSISEISALPLNELYDWIKNINLSKDYLKLAKEALGQIKSRLDFLNNIGLGYLTLDRPTKTLSGGEFQRLNISNQLGTELSDTLYVLDEPTIGLHPRDNKKLISVLKKLHENKNTLVVVEHDRDVIETGDHIIEMGPGSGHEGGKVVFQGSSEEFMNDVTSLTSGFLRERKSWEKPEKRKKEKVEIVKIKGCSGNNLKSVDFELPLNKFVCITGVSGSGKSSIVTQTLYPAIIEKLTGNFQEGSLPYSSIKVPNSLINVDFVDQQRISRSKRSLVATYLKIFDGIRKSMASTPEAKFLGYTPSSFSLNTEGGRCPKCKGLGFEEVDMLFMDNIEIPCDECEGKRYTSDILKIRYQNKNITEILNMTCGEAKRFFAMENSITKTLGILEELGLNYLKLGQSLDTLSGGESQRLKLAKYLMSSSIKNRMFIFDEPTTGLHFREIDLLLSVFQKLVESGASVVVIEHNLEVIASADWIVDIGPEAGKAGGEISYSGPPFKIPTATNTGAYLHDYYSGADL